MSATITGGASITTVNPAEQNAAVAALNAAVAASGKSTSTVYTSLTQAVGSGVGATFPVYELAAGNYALNGTQTAVILETDGASTVRGSTGATNQVIVGNDSADRISVTGGSSTVILGAGANTVVVDGGAQSVVTTGSALQTISAENGANVNISGTANIKVDLQAGRTVTAKDGSTRTISGQDTISTATTAKITIAGNDTITLGTGNDTVSANGAATIYGGSTTLLFHANGGGALYAGSGAETLVGGSTGSLQFFGSTSTSSMDVVHGGGGANTIQGGAGSDTIYSGTAVNAAATDVFEFSSSIHGGTHVINNFSTSNDQIDLQGYSSTQAQFTNSGGNTVIKLDDGTNITVKGAVLSSTSSQVHFS
jgi:Ca2+-binding RTX toxin-like protein